MAISIGRSDAPRGALGRSGRPFWPTVRSLHPDTKRPLERDGATVQGPPQVLRGAIRGAGRRRRRGGRTGPRAGRNCRRTLAEFAKLAPARGRAGPMPGGPSHARQPPRGPRGDGPEAPDRTPDGDRSTCGRGPPGLPHRPHGPAREDGVGTPSVPDRAQSRPRGPVLSGRRSGSRSAGLGVEPVPEAVSQKVRPQHHCRNR